MSSMRPGRRRGSGSPVPCSFGRIRRTLEARGAQLSTPSTAHIPVERVLPLGTSLFNGRLRDYPAQESCSCTPQRSSVNHDTQAPIKASRPVTSYLRVLGGIARDHDHLAGSELRVVLDLELPG